MRMLQKKGLEDLSDKSEGLFKLLENEVYQSIGDNHIKACFCIGIKCCRYEECMGKKTTKDSFADWMDKINKKGRLPRE